MSKEIEKTQAVQQILIDQHTQSLVSLGERCTLMEKFRLIVYSYFGAIITILALGVALNRFADSIIAFLTD